MLIDKKMLNIIRKNAIVSIGTDGLVGNKVVNIAPSGEPAPLAEPGDILLTKKAVDTEEMLETLYNTNNDIALVAAGLKSTIERVNNSSALWSLMDDKSLPADVKSSIARLRYTTQKTADLADNLNTIITDIKSGKGSVGAVLTDTSFAVNLNEAILKIKSVGNAADSLSCQISQLVAGIQYDIRYGKGTVNALFNDSLIVTKLSVSLDNIQKGTENFNHNMEALKHNFLFRGYFRKLKKKKLR
jgi:phospholipid/cholesterol/gamma-HCH transport system substrate-binding protein